MIESNCYMCGESANNVEHVPAKCFFPKGQRQNLITVPSCSIHNQATSKDDEYVRGVIVSAAGNNKLAVNHWRGDVRKTYIHSPKLFLETFKVQKDKVFFFNRARIDNVMIKIAYALYFHTFKKKWHSNPAPFYDKFYNEDGQTDIEFRLPNFEQLKYDIYEGENQTVFKYQYFECTFNGKKDVYFKLIFYEGFEVLIFPVYEGIVSPLLILDFSAKIL